MSNDSDHTLLHLPTRYVLTTLVENQASHGPGTITLERDLCINDSEEKLVL